ncbi:hypothetical protein MELB17_09368 [Marinobacter sp. ELB17]|nr:hypothetical protein MELB17_09578 [Marinobacter sp. ELB17]EAZ97336.1 hypothetical protein MELB17_09368 [Marinobacter sp. ELB17]
MIIDVNHQSSDALTFDRVLVLKIASMTTKVNNQLQ